MSSDPTVLGMINDNLKGINKKMDEVCLGQTALQLSDAEMKARLSAVELKSVQQYEEMHKMENKFRDHYKDSASHYQSHFTETFTEKMWRKKAEITVAAIIGSAAGIMALLATYGVI